MKYQEQRGRAKRKSYAGAENYGNKSWEYGISGEKIAQDLLGLQTNALAQPYSMALPSAQDRLGLAFSRCSGNLFSA